MTLLSTKYVIITPARDEELHLRKTIESMLKQTILPTEWIIVNDGSEDSTGKIIDEYAAQYPWIRAVHRQADNPAEGQKIVAWEGLSC